MGQEIHEIRNKLDEIAKAVNQMIPDVKNCVRELEMLGVEQGIIRTIMQKHDTTIDFHTRDIAAIGSQVDTLQINQAIYKTSAAAAGEPIKWASFLEFIVVLPKYGKIIIPWVATIASAAWAAWEMLKK